MKVPDGNKPIRVGDSSFIYKGIYHPIHWLGKDPYRPRVEMLVIKEDSIYLRLKDDIDKTPPDKRTHMYAIPGGSIDSDSSHLEQAIAETNEEALVQVTLVYNTGITYYDLYEPGFLLKGGDMPIEYVGSVSEVFVGIYDGPYDKSKVAEKDLDDDMANNGKFHDIKTVAKYLRKEHVEALLRSQFISDEIKAVLRLSRLDVINESLTNESPILVPGDLLYHGSTYEIDQFKPMSLDLGNAFQEPGWSTFCFTDYDFAKMFAAARAFTKMIQDSKDGEIDEEKAQVEFVVGHLVMRRSCFEFLQYKDLLNVKVKFYVYTIDPTGLDIGIGNDPALKEYTFRDSGVTPKKVDTYQLSLMDLKESVEVMDDDSDIVHPNESEYKPLLIHNYQTEDTVRNFLQTAIDNGELHPGDDIGEFLATHNKDFDSNDISIPELSVGTEESVFEHMGAVMEQKYPDSTYGLPERKAYPMPDEKHVRSAIRFFNYASKDEEKELARNINKKIRKFHIKDINVGDKNRFKKYYQPIAETFNLNVFACAGNECMRKINDEESTPEERFKVYDTMKRLTRMLIQYLADGEYDAEDAKKLDPESIENLTSQAYNTLAEIASNQTECIQFFESKDVIRQLNLNPVMEADDDDDDDETATDYTKMADDQGAEDDDPEPDDTGDDTGDDDNTDGGDDADAGDDAGDDGGDTPDDTGDADDGGDDTATDYTAMADDQGAEGAGEDEPEEGGDEGDTGDDTGEDTGNDTDTGDDTGDDDTTDDTVNDTGDDTSGEDSGDDSTDDSSEGENSENDKRYNNKEIKNYFLLNSFLSMHETVVDVLDTVNGVVLPTSDANSIMAKVVKNLQSIKLFIEKFIQFQFNDSDYAFNLYYYNILMNALRMNLQLFETAVKVGGGDAENKKVKKEE
jgi:hypothetical protein